MTVDPPDPLKFSDGARESKAARTEAKTARSVSKTARHGQRASKAILSESKTEQRSEREAQRNAREELRAERAAERAAAREERTRARELPGSQLESLVGKLRSEIAQIAEARGPVLVGPFTGEVGFELLYWIPLVRWAVREFPQLQGRLVVISRGGVAHWWRSFIEADYIDVFSLHDPEELVRMTPAKQRSNRYSDDDILARARNRLGVEGVSFHPSLLFEFYYQARKIDPDAFVREVRHRPDGADGLAALYDPISRPELDEALAALLPEEFVAVRFYFRESFPDTPENRSFAAATIASLARSQPVVALNNRLELDDHSDVSDLPAGVITLDHLMTPENNLGVQTAALARARTFVGTYGGLSYLGPMLQVPAIGFSSKPQAAASWHLTLAQLLFAGDPFAQLVTLRPGDLPLLDILAPLSGEMARTDLTGRTSSPPS